MKNAEVLKKSLIISIFYVGLSTFALFSTYPDSSFHGDWTIYALVFTFPVSIISFGLLYGEVINRIVIFMIQIIMFFITWYIVYKSLKR